MKGIKATTLQLFLTLTTRLIYAAIFTYFTPSRTSKRYKIKKMIIVKNTLFVV